MIIYIQFVSAGLNSYSAGLYKWLCFKIIRIHYIVFTSVENSRIYNLVKILLFLQCRSKFPWHTQTSIVCFLPTWTTPSYDYLSCFVCESAVLFFKSVKKRNNHRLYIFHIWDSVTHQWPWTNGSRLFRANTMLLLPISPKITFITLTISPYKVQLQLFAHTILVTHRLHKVSTR